MKLTLPWPPSMNTYWRSIIINGRIRVLLSEKGRRYRINATAAIWHAIGKPETIREPCVVDVVVFPPDRRARDLDNLNKGILDALTHAGVIEDDSLIDRLTVQRSIVSERPRVEVSVEVMVKGEIQGSLIA
jgi:crossover junction endodeoxyribonuclease RusA